MHNSTHHFTFFFQFRIHTPGNLKMPWNSSNRLRRLNWKLKEAVGQNTFYKRKKWVVGLFDDRDRGKEMAGRGVGGLGRVGKKDLDGWEKEGEECFKTKVKNIQPLSRCDQQLLSELDSIEASGRRSEYRIERKFIVLLRIQSLFFLKKKKGKLFHPKNNGKQFITHYNEMANFRSTWKKRNWVWKSGGKKRCFLVKNEWCINYCSIISYIFLLLK